MGLLVLRQKVLALLFLGLAVIPVLLVLALRPIVLIRFGALHSDRIGPFAGFTELYLCKRDYFKTKGRTLDVFFNKPQVCNQQLKEMWDRTLHVSSFARWLYWIFLRLPGHANHLVPLESDIDPRGLLERVPVHLSFTGEEERFGVDSLQKMGVSNGAPFVCILSRDSAYLNAAFPTKNWVYHDYRDSNIENFIPAAEDLVRRGYFAIRMGAVVKEALNTTNPKIIDYATNGRTDFLDVYLGGNCHFYLGDSGGFDAMVRIFRRPLVRVNSVHMELASTWGRCLFLPKKLWLKEENRYMIFREVVDARADVGTEESWPDERLGLEIRENEPEEILAVAVEMDERLKGTWQTTEEDEELQRRVWSLLKIEDPNEDFRPRMGAEFLRQNQELLV